MDMNQKDPSPKESPSPPDSSSANTVKEMAPTRAKERTWRSGIGFTVLMLSVLGLAIWYTQHSEEKKDASQLYEAETGSRTLLPPEHALKDSQPQLAVPEVTLPPEIGRGNGRSVLDAYDSEKMGRAMGEVRIGTDYSREKDWDSAELHARRALEIWPDMNEAQRLLGFIFSQRGQFAQAAAILEKALESGPFSGETFNNLATAYMHGGELDKAEDLYFTALQIRPDFYIANLNLGLLYLRQGRYDEAVDNLERGLEQMPDGVGPRNNLAVALFRLGRYDEARDHLELIIDRNPVRGARLFQYCHIVCPRKELCISHGLDQAGHYTLFTRDVSEIPAGWRFPPLTRLP